MINQLLKLYYERIFTSLQFSDSSTINLLKLRGGKGCKLTIGSQSIILCHLHFDKADARIHIGSKSFIGKSQLIAANDIFIGDNVLISWGVTVVDHNSHSVIYSERSLDVTNWIDGNKDWKNVVCEPVRINDKAWIGFNSIILKGVTIGEGAIVGSGSVVTKDVPPWTIVGGNPAKIIREISENER
jgi:acetyltransferase-like isoleucine patch superfamily enzyme